MVTTANWTMFFTFILIYSQLFFHGLQASQPFGYIGCLPDSSFNSQHASRIGLNHGVYCIGFCNTTGFRYAATKGQICKCASNLTTSDLKGNDSCKYICLGRKSERCGGESSVSLYDTLLYPNCVEHPYGLTSLIGEKPNPESQRYENNSATMCASHCKTLEYKFSGTKKKLCICGDRINDALNNSVCETKCPGNEEEICGGVYSVSLRDTGLQEPNYRKCVEDAHGFYTLKHDGSKRYADQNNSATQCATECNKLGYPLSGTKVNLCICGNRLNPDITESFKCETECPGNKTETCGGDGSVSIRYTGYVTLTTTTSSTTMTSSTIETSSTTMTSNTTETSSTPITPNTTMTSSTKMTSSTTKSNTDTPSTTTKTSKTKVTPSTAVTSGSTKPNTSPEFSVNQSTQTTEEKLTDESTESTYSVFPYTNASNSGTTSSASKGSQLTAVYITLPVIIVAGSVALIVCLILRRRRQKRETSVTWAVPRSSQWEPNSERNEMSGGVMCEEITTQAIQADDKCDAEYSEILHSNNRLDSNQAYDLINAKPSAGTNAHGIYSHFILTTGIPNSNTTDNTYSHVGSATRQFTKPIDNTYSTFQSSQQATNTSAPSLEYDDQNSVYDSANVRDKRQVNEMSEYSHLNIQHAKNTSAPSLEYDDQNSVYDSANARDKRQVNEMSEYSHLNIQHAKNTSAPSLEYDDQNTIYDSANARDKRQVNEMSEYSHLNTVNTFK